VRIALGCGMDRHFLLERVEPVTPSAGNYRHSIVDDILLFDGQGQLRCQAITSGRLAPPIVRSRVVRAIHSALRSPEEPSPRRRSHASRRRRFRRSDEMQCRRRSIHGRCLVGECEFEVPKLGRIETRNGGVKAFVGREKWEGMVKSVDLAGV